MAMTFDQATQAGLEWVPEDHPYYGRAGYVGSTPQSPTGAAGTSSGPAAPSTALTPPAPGPDAGSAVGTPNTPGSNVVQQAGNASTYSQTPGQAPAATTANQGAQDVVRNSYLEQATQGTQIDRNDPAFRQQSDAYAAGIERARRNASSNAAEAGGPFATGAVRGEQRMINERAAQATAGFEAELVGRELQNRRDEIRQALEGLTGLIDQDQRAALQRELANIDAQLRQAGIESNENIARADLALRDKLGTGGLQLDLADLVGRQRLGYDRLGFDAAAAEAGYNNDALRILMGY